MRLTVLSRSVASHPGLVLCLWTAATVCCAVPGTAYAASSSSLVKRYFTVPESTKARKSFLRRWEKKLPTRGECEAHDLDMGDQIKRSVVTRLSIANKSKWTLDFSGAGKPAVELGVIPPGRSTVERVMEAETATITLRADGGRTYQWVQTNPRAEIPFKVFAKTGETLSLRIIVEVPIEADRGALKVAGMPKGNAPLLQLQLGPQQSGQAKSTSRPTKGKKTSRRGGDAEVDAQREKWKDVNAKIGTTLIEHETKHFIVYSDLPDREALAKGCEKVYSALRNVFDLKRKQRPWKGKCVIFLFRNREDFVRFGTEVDGYSSTAKTGGYFVSRKIGPHIAIPQPHIEQGKQKQFASTVVHEMGHAFLEGFCEKGDPESWLHEGVAQACELLYDPNDRALMYHRQTVKGWVTSGRVERTFDHMLDLKHIAGNDHDSYRMAWSMVNWMTQTEAKRFRKLLRLVRDGKTGRQAIEEAFGKDIAELERYWQGYVRARY